MNDVLTARPTLPAKWDKRGAWRCSQCNKILAFVGRNIDGKPDVRTSEFFEKNGVWVHLETGFQHAPNARERADLKRAKKLEMRAEGVDEETIQAEMEGLDWMFKSTLLGTMPARTKQRLEVVKLPALFECPRCKRRAKIAGAG